jgi:hypothetical protein
MGYTTDFSGQFTLDKPLAANHLAYLQKFAETRRMKRDETITAGRPDPFREAVGLPVGIEGEFFVAAGGDAAQEGMFGGYEEKSPLGILDSNRPAKTQPGLWCQWVPTSDGTAIEWDGGEKFYDYVEWLEYLIANFLKPWGYVLNGSVEWSGEDRGDVGVIEITNNEVNVKQGHIVYE